MVECPGEDQCPCKKNLSLSAMQEYSKCSKYHLQARKRAPEPLQAGTLMSDFSVSRTGGKKCLLFKPPSLRYFVIAV